MRVQWPGPAGVLSLVRWRAGWPWGAATAGREWRAGPLRIRPARGLSTVRASGMLRTRVPVGSWDEWHARGAARAHACSGAKNVMLCYVIAALDHTSFC